MRQYSQADNNNQGMAVMNGFRPLAAFAALFALSAQAHDSGVSRYKVAELQRPASLVADCLSGYFSGASITRINDFGVVNASSNCWTSVDPANPPATRMESATFVAAPWFGAVELPRSNDGFSYSHTINNQGELFGYEAATPDGGGLFATKWSLAGGRERIFVDPTCTDDLQFQAAIDGNGRYIVGWALRGDPNLPPPVDELCIRMRWVIRDAAGVETSGPMDGSPAALNAQDVAVGIVNRAAVRYHVPTGQTVVLHAVDSAHSAEATDINDQGEIAGRITVNSRPDFFNQCDPGVAVRWDRNGREYLLPHLPGAVSSHAFGVGYDGEVVGDSGAGQYCPFYDNSQERAVLWKGGRVHDLNTLIPRSAGITLTYAYSVNRRGQITAGGYVNDEPLTSCPEFQYDPATGTPTFQPVPCRNLHMFVLTPVGR